MPSCCIPGCGHTWRSHDKGIIMHGFPTDPLRIRAWLLQAQHLFENLDEMVQQVICGKPNDRYRLCSHHFETEAYFYEGHRKRLRPNAVPTIFPSREEVQDRLTIEHQHKAKRIKRVSATGTTTVPIVAYQPFSILSSPAIQGISQPIALHVPMTILPNGGLSAGSPATSTEIIKTRDISVNTEYFPGQRHVSVQTDPWRGVRSIGTQTRAGRSRGTQCLLLNDQITVEWSAADEKMSQETEAQSSAADNCYSNSSNICIDAADGQPIISSTPSKPSRSAALSLTVPSSECLLQRIQSLVPLGPELPESKEGITQRIKLEPECLLQGLQSPVPLGPELPESETGITPRIKVEPECLLQGPQSSVLLGPELPESETGITPRIKVEPECLLQGPQSSVLLGPELPESETGITLRIKVEPECLLQGLQSSVLLGPELPESETGITQRIKVEPECLLQELQSSVPLGPEAGITQRIKLEPECLLQGLQSPFPLGPELPESEAGITPRREMEPEYLLQGLQSPIPLGPELPESEAGITQRIKLEPEYLLQGLPSPIPLGSEIPEAEASRTSQRNQRSRRISYSPPISPEETCPTPKRKGKADEDPPFLCDSNASSSDEESLYGCSDTDDKEPNVLSDDDDTFLNSSIDPSNTAYERKFVVFESSLRKLISLIPCTYMRTCHAPLSRLYIRSYGSMAIITVQCEGGHKYRLWNSQPLVRKVPAGNLLLASGVQLSGNSFVRIQQFFKVCNIAMISKWTYNRSLSKQVPFM